MCSQLIFRFQRSTLMITLLSSSFLVAFSQHLIAQPIDIADQALASREQLATQIAAVAGDSLRAKLLESAENQQLANWYSGKVQIDGQWLTLEAAQQHAAKDKDLIAYRDLREQATDSAVSHERLARWCQKRELTDLANMHWMHVLRFAPQHRAALNKLELRWHQGLLLSYEEVENYKKRERVWAKEKKEWQAQAKRLRRELERNEPEQQLAARQELRQIKAPTAVPALVEAFTEPATTDEKTAARQTELMITLGGIDAPTAIETLAQFAVQAPDKTVRYTAIDQLKSKPLEKYVPALLAGMATPIEASVCFNEVGNRIVSSYSYSQVGPGNRRYESDHNSYTVVPGRKYDPVALLRSRYVRAKTTFVPGGTVVGSCGATRVVPDRYVHTPGHTVTRRVGTTYVENRNYQNNKQRTLTDSQAKAERHGNQIVQRNIAIQHQNQRITTVLTEVTGETLAAFPKSWWNWWGDYLDRNPGVATLGTRQQLNVALMNQQQRGLARGTWVWTRQGKRSVETVLPGDYVLAQDPQTGELAYQVVLAIAPAQSLKVSEVELADAELHCAPGHVVWATGSGWQRVSKLAKGQSLHGLNTEARVSQVETAFEIDSYDLIVDGFHTFFIGEQGLLVHDATPVGPAHVALPGFSPAAVADAAQLASNGH